MTAIPIAMAGNDRLTKAATSKIVGSVAPSAKLSSMHVAKATFAATNHLSCCRSTPRDRRNRATTAATARTSDSGSVAAARLSPTGESASFQGSPMLPSGLFASESPWSPGLPRKSATPTTYIATSVATAHRQRGPGSQPSGTSKASAGPARMIAG